MQRKTYNQRMNAKPMFNISGLFDKPYQRVQVFNTTSSSINPGITNLNNSFDVSLLRAHNPNDFSIPFMLPKKLRNMSSSSQTKYTIESILDDPIPFNTHLKVSNFVSQMRTNTSED